MDGNQAPDLFDKEWADVFSSLMQMDLINIEGHPTRKGKNLAYMRCASRKPSFFQEAMNRNLRYAIAMNVGSQQAILEHIKTSDEPELIERFGNTIMTFAEDFHKITANA